MKLEDGQKIKILGHEYILRLVDNEELDSFGQQHNARNWIRLRKDAPQSQLEEGFLHEVLHAVDSELDHDLVELLAQAIYCVLKENNFLT